MAPVRRGDGQLSHELMPGEKGPQDECGVFGVWAPGEDVSRLTYFGIYALQHRGQQSAGIATSNGEKILVYKDLGLVSQVFDDQALAAQRGHIALGHVRYASEHARTWEASQPTLGPGSDGTIALGTNGALTNSAHLREQLRAAGAVNGELARGCNTDTSVITALLSGALDDSAPELDPDEELTPQEATAMRVLPMLQGAFSMVFIDEHTLYAARDRYGVRPLVLGRLATGWVVASETAALDIVGATFIREIAPGEFLAIDESGVRSRRFAESEPRGCVFEYVYLARPDTRIADRPVNEARTEMGRRLALEHPVEADLVIPTPESGTPAAIGYAQMSGIPFAQGLVKNSYIGRTFIEPTETIRRLGIRLKLNPLREVVAGKRLVVVDDSIVRGNTQRAIVTMLREAGAAEIHVRISSPPVKWPCFYGVDFATRAELIANSLTGEEIRSMLGADSLGYISLEGMIEATKIPRGKLCTACFSGDYPIPVPLGQGLTVTEHRDINDPAPRPTGEPL